MKQLFLLAFPFLLSGCQLFTDSETAARKTAKHWAEAYFNYDFHAAEALATPESGRWLQYAASNTTQQELDALPDGGATAEVTSLSLANDTTAVATIMVSDYVWLSAIGRPYTVVDEGVFHMPLVKRGSKWYVRMEGLPRSEKQSRD